METSQCQETSLRLEQRLTLKQRKTLGQYELGLRLLLVSLLNPLAGPMKYTPTGVCPKCHRELTPLEILAGFLPDPTDFRTVCPRCKTPFVPKLIWGKPDSRVEIPFFCQPQTVAQLRGLESLSPEEFLRDHQVLYHSAIVHFGLLKNAFISIGMVYLHDEGGDLRAKVSSFLGVLPDAVISRYTDLSVHQIRRMRKKSGIPPCTRREMLAAASIEL